MAGTKIGTPKKTESSAVSKKYEKNGMVQTPRDISARCALGSGATPVSAWVRELNGPVKSNDSRWAKHQAERNYAMVQNGAHLHIYLQTIHQYVRPSL